MTEDDVEIYREALYPFEGKLARVWRADRVFLAGDAAHLMTPFYGQGGCSGLRDSINLAWKLDLVLKGIAGTHILDTYQSERMPHVRVHIDNSDILAAAIFINDPKEAAERDRSYLAGHAPAPKPDKPIVDGIVDRVIGQISAVTGTIGPQGRIRFGAQEGRFDDLFGWGFQLICADPAILNGLGGDHRAFLETIGANAVAIAEIGDEAVQDIDGVYRAYFEKHGLGFVLMRPDFVVFSASADGNDLPAAVDRLQTMLEPLSRRSVAA